MLPIGDQNIGHGAKPYIVYIIIGLNGLVFLYELILAGSVFVSNSLDVTQFFHQWGFIPKEIFSGSEETRARFITGISGEGYIQTDSLDIRSPVSPWATAFSSMFIHGGWIHLSSNMLYLWVFGDNIEFRFGHLKFFIFYLASGLAAIFVQSVFDTESISPMIGASGAISGVTGAYLVLFPFSKIRTLVIFYFVTVIHLPTVVLLGFWFILQLVKGLGTLGGFDDGVAYWAHIGGFIAGIVAATFYNLMKGNPLWPRKQSRRNDWNVRPSF